jgi:hypothetical protein
LVRRIGVVRLEAIGRPGIAKLGLSIVARDVSDRAVADGYHVTILKRVLLDLATVHEGTVCTPEI